METLELSRQILTRPELAGELAAVDPFALQGDAARLAFWMNVHNACFRHAPQRPHRGKLWMHPTVFDRASYRVGAHEYSLNAIEHGVLRLNKRPIGALLRVFKARDPRVAAQPSRLDPRIHFALHCGARSCPIVRPYHAETVDAELEEATRLYFRQESRIQGGEVLLPRLCKYYQADFGDLLAFARRYIDVPQDARVGFAPYDWTVIP